MKNAFVQFLECKFTLTIYKLALSLVCKQFCWGAACHHEELLGLGSRPGRRRAALYESQAEFGYMLTTYPASGHGNCTSLTSGKLALRMYYDFSYLLAGAKL